MVDGEELRAVMRAFPSGVAVVAFVADGEAQALTVGSLVSLSLEPPLVGVSIGHQTTVHELLRSADAFAVSVLAADQGGVAQHFARSGLPPVARWVGIATRTTAHGPLIDGAAAWLGCGKRAEHPVGDHTLFVGGVEAAERGPGSGGLAYLEREYVAVSTR